MVEPATLAEGVGGPGASASVMESVHLHLMIKCYVCLRVAAPWVTWLEMHIAGR